MPCGYPAVTRIREETQFLLSPRNVAAHSWCKISSSQLSRGAKLADKRNSGGLLSLPVRVLSIPRRADDSRLLSSQEVDPVPDVLPEDYKVCPEMLHCGLNCDLIKDEDGCTVCACQTPPRYYPPPNDTVPDASNDKKICPEVKCDLHCERGLVMDENDCTFCECKPSAVGCPPLLGCRKRCSFGYKTSKRGCPVSVTLLLLRDRLAE